ncbi:uncharacterized protein LOC130629134 [Hydractinia symbiolongicarpus]|uniref:uncharacterized protein LOC130629134 n=1 Tax=Hydractinia symbiolongicarpus TaxID=13093 RepID=UPI00254E475D|nr:uncharacterized protein LOC130629134 [Hydractinia symbiolongicarpus]
MKCLLFVVASILLLQFATAQDGSVTPKTCEDFLPQKTCDNLRKVATLLHEKATTVRDAVQAAIAHHKTKASEMLTFIKEYLAEKMPCEKVLTEKLCNQLSTLGDHVKLTALQVRLAIENAVSTGATKVTDIYKKAVDFMTTEITCSKIFGQVACDNMVEAMKKLKEQSQLLNEAIMTAAQKHYTNVKNLLVSVKETLVEKVTNFQCTDVMTQSQCDFITNLAKKFHIKATELNRAIVEAVFNGTKSIKQIYDITIGELIEKAKNVKCEDLIPKDTCDKLDAFAKNVHLKVSDVTMAVKVAIASGVTTVGSTAKFVREYLAEKLSCDTFLSESTCQLLEKLANKLHVSFKKVIEKLRSLYASGVTKVSDIYKTIVEYVWGLFWGDAVDKRQAEFSLKDMLRDKIMKLVEKVITISKDLKIKLKADINKLIEDGKVTILNVRQYVKDLISKYGPQSDEVTAMDDVHKSLIEKLKDALKKAHGKAKVVITELLAKTKDQLEKIKEYVKQILNNQGQYDESLDVTHDLIAEMAYKTIDDEAQSAADEIMQMM